MEFRAEIKRTLTGPDKLRAVCSVILDDCFLVKNVRVVEGEKGMFVSLPSRRNVKGEWTEQCFPMTKELREKLSAVVLAEYDRALAEDGGGTPDPPRFKFTRHGGGPGRPRKGGGRWLEYILVLLIVALLNGAIAYIDGLMEGIVPLTLYAEQYMSTLAGVDLFEALFDIVFGFGVSLIILKFLKKGFETYVLWSDGDADEEPIALLTNFFKAMAVAVCFPTMYGWLAGIVEEMSDKMLEAIGLATAYDWAGWVSGISTLGLVTAIFGLVFVIVYFILYFQFLMRGLEILILRVGMPLACVGLIDNDKGVFKPYMSKFFQSALSVIIQIALAKLGVGLMMNMHIFWGVACMILAVRTPKFLQEFIVTTGGGGGGAIVNNAYHSVRLVQMVKGMGK